MGVAMAGQGTPVHTLAISLLFLVMALCAFNPKMLTGEKQLGIDLGTTFSVVALCERGNVSVLAVDESRTTPSVVSVLESDGSVIVGHGAALRRLTHPLDTIYNVKRI